MRNGTEIGGSGRCRYRGSRPATVSVPSTLRWDLRRMHAVSPAPASSAKMPMSARFGRRRTAPGHGAPPRKPHTWPSRCPTDRTASRCLKTRHRTAGGPVSRATRRYKRWERDSRAWALESANERALDLQHCRASAIKPYGNGVALEPGEVLNRQLWAPYWTLGEPTELVDGFGHFGRRGGLAASRSWEPRPSGMSLSLK